MTSDDNHQQETADAASWLRALDKRRMAIVMLDMVESVRLIADDTAGVIGRWHAFTRRVRDDLLPTHEGTLVKSLGDGMLLTFPTPRHAVAAARELHAAMDGVNAAAPTLEPILLRAGVDVGEIVADDLDVYGHRVNLAARLMALAGPGETIASADVRDAISDGLDADVEDLGDCYVKHVPQPLRAYRMSRPGPSPLLHGSRALGDGIEPTIAVIPFEARSADPEHFAIGELVADCLISQLSRTRELRVISRLSTTAFRGRKAGGPEIQAHLGATFAISGGYAVDGHKLLVNAELAKVATGEVIWAGRLTGSIGDLFEAQSELCDRIAQQCHRAVLDTEARAAMMQPLPSLASYSLLLGGIGLMHRSSPNEFMRTRAVLEALAERHARHAAAHVWLAKWYVLRNTRGMGTNPRADAGVALDHTRRALDREPENGLALAMQGFVQCHLAKDIDAAQATLEAAVRANESEPLAWLFKGMIHAFDGDGANALPAGLEASRLSPIDPMRYYFDSLLASIYITAKRYDDAIAAATRALRANAIHTSTYRALVLAQSLSGRMTDARATLARLGKLDPGFTVERFRRNFPGRDRAPAFLSTLADALLAAGVPEH